MDKIRILLLGVGKFGSSWAQSVIPACADRAAFVGAVDLVPDRAAHLPEGVSFFTDLDAALNAVHPQLVINVTPPRLHTEHNMHLLALGHAVLCEKPIAADLADAERMLAYYQQHGGFLMIGDNYRYSPAFRACRRMLQSGELGGIHSVQCHFRHHHPDYSAFYHGQLAQPLLLDVAIHHLDVARYLMAEEPISTRCETWSAPYTWYQHRPASASIQSRMTGDMHFSYFGTLASPASTTDWNGDWEIECDRGVLRVAGSKLYLYDQPNAEPVAMPLDDQPESRIPMLKEAILALTEGRKAESDLTDNIKTYRWVLDAIRASEERG